MGIDLRAKTVGENIETDGLLVSGGIRLSSGGDSPVVDARWGQIQGTLANQADLMAALNEKASASALNALAVTVGEKADEQDLLELAGDVAEKLTTPSGVEGQFMVYRSGEWVGETLAEWNGGSF